MIATEKKCRYPGCKRPMHARGLCRACYSQADRLVRSGRTTWAALEKKRKVSKLSGRTKGFSEWLLA